MKAPLCKWEFGTQDEHGVAPKATNSSTMEHVFATMMSVSEVHTVEQYPVCS
jgi:hypothetical protein